MSEAVGRLTLSGRTTLAMQDVLAGARRGPKSVLLFAGPAVIASIAYVDPGNIATNIQAGSKYEYGLLWVVVLANVIAMLFQAMSAKLGIVTNRSLPELCREQFPQPVVLGMWIGSEVAAMATDLAEFLGAAIALSLLFHMPLLVGMGVGAVLTGAILLSDRAGFRPLELIIAGFVGVIGICYVAQLAFAPPDWGAAAFHSVVPQLGDAGALTLAVGIIGSTVMPHAIYLHSGLAKGRVPTRNDGERRKLVRFATRETMVSLAVAGLVNMAMVASAATLFHSGHQDLARIEDAYHLLFPILGVGAAAVFLVALLASGISSSVVGTMAGQMIMQGFVGFHIPVWLRRVITVVPAFAVVAAGLDVTRCLVISQVVLSITLPLPMIALVVLSRRRAVMKDYVAGRAVSTVAIAGAAIVLVLNLVLVAQACGIDLPYLAPG